MDKLGSKTIIGASATFTGKIANARVVEVHGKVNADLIAEKVIVRNRAKVLLCEDCLRITVGTRIENEALLKALKKVVK